MHFDVCLKFGATIIDFPVTIWGKYPFVAAQSVTLS